MDPNFEDDNQHSLNLVYYHRKNDRKAQNNAYVHLNWSSCWAKSLMGKTYFHHTCLFLSNHNRAIHCQKLHAGVILLSHKFGSLRMS